MNQVDSGPKFKKLMDRIDDYYIKKKENSEYDKLEIEFNKINEMVNMNDKSSSFCRYLFLHFKIKNQSDYRKAAVKIRNKYGESSIVYKKITGCNQQVLVFPSDKEINEYYGISDSKIKKDKEEAEQKMAEAEQKAKEEAEKKANKEAEEAKAKTKAKGKEIAKEAAKKAEQKAKEKAEAEFAAAEKEKLLKKELEERHKKNKAATVITKMFRNKTKKITKKRKRRSLSKSKENSKSPSNKTEKKTKTESIFGSVFRFFSKKPSEENFNYEKNRRETEKKQKEYNKTKKEKMDISPITEHKPKSEYEEILKSRQSYNPQKLTEKQLKEQQELLDRYEKKQQKEYMEQLRKQEISSQLQNRFKVPEKRKPPTYSNIY